MPSTAPFQPVQFGHYLLVSQLGRGGMAEVYKARASGAAGFSRTVCVKRILKQHSADEHFLGMFVNEAKISARLSHPNIVQVYELGEVDGEFFMAMEFVHGRDLLRVMRANAETGPLPAPVAAYIAREMCRALAHAHDHVGDDGQPAPIIHRDVSPQNVMISFDGIVKLVDFGIAKAAQMPGVEETRTGALKGKFAYMAPEQLDGQRATPLCDVFAVGVVLHEMLTGRRLFKGNSDYDTLVRVKSQPIPPPSTLAPGVAPELDQIVATALQRDPAARYPRAALMARDLEVYCGRAGFTSDDMKEVMRRLFPDRAEVPDGVVTIPSETGAGAAAGGRPVLGATGSGGAASRPSSGAEAQRRGAGAPAARRGAAAGGGGGQRTLIAGGAIVAILLAGGGAAVAILHQRWAPVPSPASTGEAAAPAGERARPPAASEGGRAEAAERVVTLQSNPPGAEVLSGPRVLGTTPVEVKLGDRVASLAVRLSKPGFDDVEYTVTAADAPSLTLKLPASRRRPSGSATPRRAAAVAAPPAVDENHAPKIRSFDEVDVAAPAAKVKSVDD